MFDQYLNKHVVVIQKDGFRKFGVFIASDYIFIYLKFKDGFPHGIAISEIKDIAEDTKQFEVS